MSVIETALKRVTNLIREKGIIKDELAKKESELRFFAGYVAGARAQKAEDDLKAEEWFREYQKGETK